MRKNKYSKWMIVGVLAIGLQTQIPAQAWADSSSDVRPLVTEVAVAREQIDSRLQTLIPVRKEQDGSVDAKFSGSGKGLLSSLFNVTIQGWAHGEYYNINSEESVFALNVVPDGTAERARAALAHGDNGKTNKCFREAAGDVLQIAESPNTLTASQFSDLNQQTARLRNDLELLRARATVLQGDRRTSAWGKDILENVDKTSQWLDSRYLLIQRISYDPATKAQECGVQSGEIPVYTPVTYDDKIEASEHHNLNGALSVIVGNYVVYLESPKGAKFVVDDKIFDTTAAAQDYVTARWKNISEHTAWYQASNKQELDLRNSIHAVVCRNPEFDDKAIKALAQKRVEATYSMKEGYLLEYANSSAAKDAVAAVNSMNQMNNAPARRLQGSVSELKGKPAVLVPASESHAASAARDAS